LASRDARCLVDVAAFDQHLGYVGKGLGAPLWIFYAAGKLLGVLNSTGYRQHSYQTGK